MHTYYIDTMDKINKDTSISLLSDLHINENDDKRYNKLLNNLDNVKPNYIFILGDLIENTDSPPEVIEKIYKYLTMMSEIATIYYIYGNHETRTKIDGEEVQYTNHDFNNMLTAVSNFHILDNKSILLDENIGLTGVKFPYSYYVTEREDENKYLEILNNLIENDLLGNLNNNSFNILLQHSPNNIFDQKTYLQLLKKIKERLNKDFNFNLVLSGHQHNGLIPPYLDFLPTNRGFVGIKGSIRHLRYKNCRGIKKINDDTVGIILPAISPLPGYPTLNKLYPPTNKTLILKR